MLKGKKESIWTMEWVFELSIKDLKAYFWLVWASANMEHSGPSLLGLFNWQELLVYMERM